jgi:hypothetical protein
MNSKYILARAARVLFISWAAAAAAAFAGCASNARNDPHQATGGSEGDRLTTSHQRQEAIHATACTAT